MSITFVRILIAAGSLVLVGCASSNQVPEFAISMETTWSEPARSWTVSAQPSGLIHWYEAVSQQRYETSTDESVAVIGRRVLGCVPEERMGSWRLDVGTIKIAIGNESRTVFIPVKVGSDQQSVIDCLSSRMAELKAPASFVADFVELTTYTHLEPVE